MSSPGNGGPRIGFGTWGLKGQVCSSSVAEALTAGFRHIDAASAYLNEREVGRGISDYLDKSLCTREELFVSNKLWVTQMGYDRAIRACHRSLRRMGLSYFDQYLIHWPISACADDEWEQRNAEAWRALETLLDEGLVRSIGVCNFLGRHLHALVCGARVVPAKNQLEMHPGKAQLELLETCAEFGIAVEAWSPLARGQLLKHPTILEIADRIGASPAQVCLSWCVCHDAIPIVRSTSSSHMCEAIEAATVRLSGEDMRKLDDMPPFGDSGLHPDKAIDFSGGNET